MRRLFIGIACIAALTFSCNKELETIVPTPPVVIPEPDDSTVHPAPNPNIVCIVMDDIGYEVPTYTGGESYETPNLDRIAAQSMQFTQCHSSPTCTASRLMLMTGKYGFRNYTEFAILDPSNKTFGNLLQDAGYETMVCGKWQLHGGSTSTKLFGFDRDVIFNPFSDDTATGGKGKDPLLYSNGAYIDANSMIGKYGEDVLNDSAVAFMRAKKNKPFFLYRTMVLAHEPFEPTPDDPEFATWVPGSSRPDKKYYPSMVKYMDKKIAQLVDAAKDLGIAENTIFIIVADNGTPHKIYSQFNGITIRGGKGFTTEYGTHVPMLVKWDGHVQAGSINNNLIDFTDFFPTIADLANIHTIPEEFYPLDGLSFHKQLAGTADKVRDYIFCHYQRTQSEPLYRWAQNLKFKEYDNSFLFFNVAINVFEKYPIKPNSAEQKQADTLFRNVFQKMR